MSRKAGPRSMWKMPNGLRQITTFYLPGEYCEPELFLSGKSALPIRALSPVVASLIPLSGIDGRAGVDVTEMLKAIVENSRRHTSLMVSLGRRTAPERIAYLTLNLFNRMDAEKKTVDGRCSFPLTQQDLGDATGMTPVHVNRVLQDLRRDGVIELTGKTLTVLDLKGLRDKAGPW